MKVLGIETSCDETAASLVDGTGVLADVVHTQAIHQAFGGVVPEHAARAHAEKLQAVVRAALAEAGVEKPDAVVATAGPGLIGAVLVGFCYGKALAAGWGVPFLGVNHLEGHLLSCLLEDPAPTFPFLALVVSGGHTTLYRADALGDYSVLASTVDDAAGEAYDKVARMLGLGYPGGPIVDRLAAQGDPTAVPLPRPRATDLDWSFSGLKTAVRQHLIQNPDARPEDVCAGFQAAVVDVLLDRASRAAERTGIRQLAFAGGVAANAELRRRAAETGLEVFFPPRSRCTDNGSMIANAGRMHLLAGATHPLSMGVQPRWSLG
ncbi:MAG: tRNA (adenosine(37)-N6)-threonylcarbamoyltransferase complex transferase subunit TsaD [Myxococcales bacterium]|nr:tRNA (adenosine(37)-N6)-threonylcarbamoyltransferase complex transferase subunit TsaD [Myxococcales bacterium]MCB9672440.1 tRNA (adenosine(37)-N6)-threonylcarbamoyltransferase complex transferase subunit TsaD [Alphaproteobacteria bacterium]MCB9693053.1 tRNA (adenosine(37)-N6)-threonylcarbamoyltransferase complex transferase subunit TsaD [Alphaproteobacteria bacterium]